MAKKFYLTTAIDYVNGRPHLGHTYEKVLADAIARYQRLKGNRVHFLTGLDEHGQKVQQKAQEEGLTPIDYCNSIATHFLRLIPLLEISNDDFVRTTQERHQCVVREVLQSFFDRGLIYKADYKGFYSVKEERFLQDKDKIDGQWPEFYGEVKEIVETNYFFKLSLYQAWLIDFLQKNPDFITPHFRQKQVVEFLKEPLNDLCISRPKERLAWGIPLPFDPNFVTYVWFDALLNYISVIGYGTEDFFNYWPVDVHVIGKDILVPAHAVYWTILLKALNLPMPKQILAHGWWLLSGKKLSKSLGNGFQVFDWIERYHSDSIRYFLLREMVTGQDSEFSMETFEARYNNELANEWGNLISRTFHMLQRYCKGVVPASDHNAESSTSSLQEIWNTTYKEVCEFFDAYAFSQGLDKIFKFIRELNRHVEIQAPWKLAKSDQREDRRRLEKTLQALIEGIRLCALLLSPIMPTSSKKILDALHYSSSNENLQTTLYWNPETLVGKLVSEKLLLFPKNSNDA